jgi:hypothetical protein
LWMRGGVDQTIPGRRSIAHSTLNNHLCRFLSNDIDTGRGIAGIMQLSVEIVHIMLTGRKLASDKAEDCCQCEHTFNRYVQLDCAPEYWAQSNIDIYGILPTNPRITGADNMHTVWPQFLLWLAEHTFAAEPILLVAWNGGVCDLKWLWRLTQAPNSQYSWPENVRYFIDTGHVITKYKSCTLNETKSKTQGHTLGVIWSYIHGGQCLENTHNSMVDAKAQTNVLTDARFVPLNNHSNSIQLISEMISKTQQNKWRKEIELCHPVHAPWVELTRNNTLQWEPPGLHKCDGPNSDPCIGPTQYIKEMVHSATNLSAVLFGILLFSCFGKVAEMTDKYAHKDWVGQRWCKDDNGIEIGRSHYVDVPAGTKGAQHCDNRKQLTVSPGFVMIFVRILMLNGTYFESGRRSASKLWQ